MKRWKRHTIVLAATLLAFIVATLGNLSYAADETKENKEAAQASAVSETQNKTTEEAASNTQPPTQAPTTDAVSETEQTTEASQQNSWYRNKAIRLLSPQPAVHPRAGLRRKRKKLSPMRIQVY